MSASTGLGFPACCRRLTWTPPLGGNNPLVDYRRQTARGGNDRTRHGQPETFAIWSVADTNGEWQGDPSKRKRVPLHGKSDRGCLAQLPEKYMMTTYVDFHAPSHSCFHVFVI